MEDQMRTLQDSGLEIKSVTWPDEACWTVGMEGVESLTLVSVAGQGGWVNWIEMKRNPPRQEPYIILINPAHLAAVEFAK